MDYYSLGLVGCLIQRNGFYYICILRQSLLSESKNYRSVVLQTQDVDFAMAASRKSQTAFVTANVILADEQNRDCVTSVKKVIDFSFQDVEELVRLVRIAMEGISRSGFGGARD